MLILVLLIVIVFLPIPVRYSFEAMAKIYPVKEWKLMRGAEEGIWSQTFDYETDALADFKNYRFERGDIAELIIKDGIPFDSRVEVDDTVAWIDSYFIQTEIIRIENLRDVEIANMNVVSTGEKDALVLQAKKQYDYAVQQLALEKKNYYRQEQLYRDSVIAPADFDLYENSMKLAEINAEVAREQLLALSTGEKASVVELAAQKIQAYNKEIERLKDQQAQYTITTPLSGILTYAADTGGIVKVSDYSRLVLKMPVAYQHSAYLAELHKVTFSTPDNKISVNATFSGFDENVILLQNKQFVVARAVTTETTPGIYPGMIVSCRFYCDRVPILEYLKRNFSVSF
jgi:hypothetical protein